MLPAKKAPLTSSLLKDPQPAQYCVSQAATRTYPLKINPQLWSWYSHRCRRIGLKNAGRCRRKLPCTLRLLGRMP